jgi:hypothetical protein
MTKIDSYQTGTSQAARARRRALTSLIGGMTLLAAALMLVSGAGYTAQPAPSVQSFSPQGTVKQVRQVTARFSEPMVPLGDPRVSAAAFSVNCAPPGTARWIDSRTWSYDFKNDLPAGAMHLYPQPGFEDSERRHVCRPPAIYL